MNSYTVPALRSEAASARRDSRQRLDLRSRPIANSFYWYDELYSPIDAPPPKRRLRRKNPESPDRSETAGVSCPSHRSLSFDGYCDDQLLIFRCGLSLTAQTSASNRKCVP